MNQTRQQLVPLVVAGMALGALALLGLIPGCTPPGAGESSHYAVRGLHRDVGCSECHTAEDIASTPTSCSGCHEAQRLADHYAGDCGDCHSENGWEYAVVDHDGLSLGGGHEAALCFDCHDEYDFTTLDAACESCHLDERPSGHFQGPCAGCHTVSAWEDATFDHAPIFPLPHRQVSQCIACHPDDTDYAVFTCIDCHEHRRSEADSEHREEGIAGYSWNSEACLRCHPRGRE